MTRNRYAWLMIVGLLLCVVPAFGQEITPEPTAELTIEPGPVFPTTAAKRSGEAYVLYAQLNAETDSVVDFPIQRVTFEALAAG